MNRLALVTFLVGSAALSACSSSSPKPAAPPPGARGGGPTVVADADACPRICAASSACGEDEACPAKCNDWLVTRGRPGIATATANCAISRIERACAREPEPRVAAVALVTCIDEAGRSALRKDRRALFVAARAICDRGARCSEGSKDDADACVDGMSRSEKIPRGLGLFGAFKPEVLDDFRRCMDTTACTAENDVSCLGQMLGSDHASMPEEEQEPGAPPSGPSTSGPTSGGATQM